MRFKIFFSLTRLKEICLLLLDANDVITFLPHAQKDMLLNIKLFSCYCEETGKPIIDWAKISKAEYVSTGSSMYMNMNSRHC